LQGAVLTGIATFLILMLQRRGQKPLEKVIGGLLLFVAAAYVVELDLLPARAGAAGERDGDP
jgi:manganese transport protein